MAKGERIGLFGGSFDPVHLGHLILAQIACEELDLRKVYFVPTAVPPHKIDRELTPFELRVKMLQLAIEGNEDFEISLIENGETPSYTYETILKFKEAGYSKDELHLLVGSDSLNDMGKWREPNKIFANATIVSMMRPGYEDIPSLPAGSAIVVLERGSNSISSTDIRELVKSGRSIKYLVPEAVEDFIKEHSLYS